MAHTDRAQYIAGLRQLADLLEVNDDLKLPYHGTTACIGFMFLTGDAKEPLAHFARIIPGQLIKDTELDGYLQLNGVLGGPNGLKIQATASRNAVCERVVTGTREITKMVPDPKVSVPLVEVTETVEDVRWECMPLLDSRPAVNC